MSKSKLLDAVVAEVVVCRKCGLWKSRKNAVPGEGSPDSRVMLIGEAPGYWEDAKGKPFMGVAGKFLDTLLSKAGLSRGTVFIGNILKCRPPRNREPLPEEIQKCTPYLDRQIRIIQPKYIVTLGNYATSYIFSKVMLQFKGITQAHGKFYETSVLDVNVAIFPTFHPAAALYHPKYKEQLIRDFYTLKNILTEKGPP